MFFYRSLYSAALATMCMVASVHAQQPVNDPTTWKYDLRKTESGHDLVFLLSLEKGWHIWALKPGGDGFQVPPSFLFDDDNRVEILGPAKEYGKRETVEMEGIDGKVHYYSDTVEYTQPARLKPGNYQVKGRHIYQVCNDKMCLPPVEMDFLIEVSEAELHEE